MTTAELLEAAKSKIDTEAKWTEFLQLRQLSESSKTTVSADKCVIAFAHLASCVANGYASYINCLEALQEVFVPYCVLWMQEMGNDEFPNTTHADIMTMFNEAIELARREG